MLETEKGEMNAYLQEFIKLSNLLLPCCNGFTGVQLKGSIHVNLNITSKELQKEVAWCFLLE